MTEHKSDQPREEPVRCPDPEHCTKLHNEMGPDGEEHHYECQCRWCQHVAWSMKQ